MRAAVLLLVVVQTAGAMGFTEDPAEKLTKSFTLAAVKSLEIRGQIDFELVPGDSPKVTVTTTRALFDQLNVSNWWGAATVAIESGLRGPREVGLVTVRIELPDLKELTVSDRSRGKGVWPAAWGTIKVREQSALDIVLEGTNFAVEASWLTKVNLAGHVERLSATLRHQSTFDAQNLQAGTAQVTVDEASTYEAGATTAGSGVARHGSTVRVPDLAAWEALVLREESVRVLRTE